MGKENPLVPRAPVYKTHTKEENIDGKRKEIKPLQLEAFYQK